MMILALPQLAADKADGNHSSVAADHFSKLPVQPREFACFRDRVPGTRNFTDARVLDPWDLQDIGVLGAIEGRIEATEALETFEGDPGGLRDHRGIAGESNSRIDRIDFV